MDTDEVGIARVRPDPPLAGRPIEQQLLVAALEQAASGQPRAVVVHGEAGVGKTQLVRRTCEGLGAGTQVLLGTCVHFGEATVPFGPVAGALQAWRAQADETSRMEVLSGAGDLGTLLPALSEARIPEPGQLLPLIDRVLNRLADRAPTVLVIDDLQWADTASLDALAYLITGFRQQRLALLATCRDEHRRDGHPLHGWLADMRRMPLFTEVHLDRINLAATETQIESLLGRAVDIDLAVQVYERSGGNPYLTELLVRGLTGSEAELPATAPAALKDALLASWHGLSTMARQVTRLLAVGGRPTELAVLTAVASEHRISPALLYECLTEARDHGVAEADGESRWWFRHPLLAEVLDDELPPGDAARMAATYVRALEARSATEPGRAADLATHNHRAGRSDETYSWSLAAADGAAVLRAAAVEAIHLERACSLWDEVSPEVRGSAAGHVDLLRRTSRVCGRAGRFDTAVSLVEHALELVDQDSEPLLTSTLLLACWEAKYRGSATEKAPLDELVEAVRLTSAYPDSAERALALAGLAAGEQWEGLHDEAVAHAEEAVRVGRKSRSEPALAGAFSTRACVRLQDSAPKALADAQDAMRLARSCGSTEWLENAARWQWIALKYLGRTEEATTEAREVFEEVLGVGSAWAYVLASSAAEGLLWLGRWNECRELLRTALAARCAGIPGASVRLTAAQLAARCGRVAEAESHLDRALELVSEDFAGLHTDVSAAGADVFLASGRPQKALRWLHSRIAVPAKSGYSEDLLVDFAHAAAETARAARDAEDANGEVQAHATLDDLIARWPSEPFTSERTDSLDMAMTKALYRAEVARCRGEAGQVELWRQAIDSCNVAGSPWPEATSRLRCAEAMLAAGSRASTVSELLRQAHATAVELGAQPLRDEVESLARMARIILREPAPIADTPRVEGALASLTAREREILTFLVAGRSNREIAIDLVISSKTVSVHVSNILRKTGTSTRLEAAALADRLATHRDN
ncbi:AAA family ATPase [Kribbella qitaiheensis]|uniref:helix-turn-helix transcriptional regulator n=1 Tax=Kribbella qitaiheensis TaxID=1544730 RepID=UPI003621710D